MKLLPKIKLCPAGHRAKLRVEPCIGRTEHWIACSISYCWQGPERKTKRGAINCWNRRVG